MFIPGDILILSSKVMVALNAVGLTLLSRYSKRAGKARLSSSPLAERNIFKGRVNI